MKELTYLQEEMFAWQRRNFPTSFADENLFGVMEEVGELSHAHLKGKQGIRHTPEEIKKMKRDAVADIAVFLMNYCSHEGIEFSHALEETWNKVKQRDWINNPMNADKHGNPDS